MFLPWSKNYWVSWIIFADAAKDTPTLTPAPVTVSKYLIYPIVSSYLNLDHFQPVKLSTFYLQWIIEIQFESRNFAPLITVRKSVSVLRVRICAILITKGKAAQNMLGFKESENHFDTRFYSTRSHNTHFKLSYLLLQHSCIVSIFNIMVGAIEGSKWTLTPLLSTRREKSNSSYNLTSESKSWQISRRPHSCHQSVFRDHPSCQSDP